MLFAMYYDPRQQQPKLVTMRSADDPASAKVIFDPMTRVPRNRWRWIFTFHLSMGSM